MAHPIPGAPSIERPDEHTVGAAGELYCWIKSSEECGPSCMAFDHRSRTIEGVSPCMVLNNIKAFNVTLSKIAGALSSKPMPAPPSVPVGR